jgi:alpha-tubulin suppressor-like RCC1 family protein
MPSPGGQFFSDEYDDIEDYFVTDYLLIDQYIGDTLWTWGNNGAGQLGINATTDRSTPVTTFLGENNWKSITGGYYHTVALKTDGTLWTWGSNTAGQLGINATTNRSTPVTTILGGTNWKSVSAGNSHTAAIKTDGTLWVWGLNGKGYLGINNTNNRSTPVTTILGGTNWKSVSAGSNHTSAIKTDGTLWLWGDNGYGYLGINNTNNRSTPVTTILGGTNWKSVSAGSNHTSAIKTDGTLWVWGASGIIPIPFNVIVANGQLGTNDNINKSIPVTTILGGTYWKSVTSGGGHTIAIKTDGTLWTWGRNNSGQLGINEATDRSTPVTTILGGTNWKRVSSGYSYTAAIKTDGTLWNWGRNNSGQLGINAATDRRTPVTTILGGTNWKSTSGAAAALTAGFNVDFS